MTESDLQRFVEKIEFTEAGCWLWTGALSNRGYGRFHFNGINSKAYRVSYEWLKGSIPEDLTLDHLCRTPRCVNPDHLEAVTMAENLRRARRPFCKFGHPQVWSGRQMVCKTCKREETRIAMRRWRLTHQRKDWRPKTW